jgi:hygromycin-B 4-O-kinase
MSPPHLTLDQVQHIVNTHLQLDVMCVEELKPGAWSSAYAFELGGEGFVIRFSHLRDDFERDAFATRFAGHYVPIPRVTHLGEIDDIHFAVSERASGDFIDSLSGEDYRRTLPSLFTTLNALRTAAVSDTSGYGGWDANGHGSHDNWPDFLRASLVDRPGERGSGWRSRLETSTTGADAFDRDIQVLDRLLDDMPADRHVLHGDLINFNCFVRDHQISGIIDWGCAMYGDFVYEIAWFSFWAPWYPQWRNVDFAKEAMAFNQNLGVDLTGFHERVRCYELHIGLAHQAYNAYIGNWNELANVTQHTTAIADKVR